MNNTFDVIIPARYESSRFPGKAIAKIAGRPMIEWVIKNAYGASLVNKVRVATDDGRIADVVKEASAEAIMTSADCPNGSARVAEVAKSLKNDWVFEMQGDQPLVTSDVIDDFITRSLKLIESNPTIDVVIPYAPTTKEHTASLDVLKVVKTESDRLVFQTRQPVKTGWRTLGLYMWRRESLLNFSKLPVSDLEKSEDSHPIRLYVNDFLVQGLLIDSDNWVEVDRPHQVADVESIMKKQRII